MYKLIAVNKLPDCFNALILASTNEGHSFLIKTSKEWKNDLNSFNKKGESFYLAYLQAEVIGCCGVNIDPYTSEHIGRIRHLYVHPKHRRKGIAKRLLTACIKQSKSEFNTFRLRTNSIYKESRQFYNHYGFHESKHIDFETHRASTSELVKKHFS